MLNVNVLLQDTKAVLKSCFFSVLVTSLSHVSAKKYFRQKSDCKTSIDSCLREATWYLCAWWKVRGERVEKKPDRRES